MNEITRTDHVIDLSRENGKLEKVLLTNLQMVGEGVKSEVPEEGEEEFSIS